MNRHTHLPVIMVVICGLFTRTGMSATWVGIEAGLGSSSYPSESDNIDTSWLGAVNVGYDVSPDWGLSLAVYTGSGSSIPREEIGVATEVDEELDYSALSVNANGYLAWSPSQSLYLTIGANYNQTEVSLERQKLIDEKGLGYTVRAGWQYHFDKHYQIHLSLQRLGLSDVDVNSVNIGVNYRF